MNKIDSLRDMARTVLTEEVNPYSVVDEIFGAVLDAVSGMRIVMKKGPYESTDGGHKHWMAYASVAGGFTDVKQALLANGFLAKQKTAPQRMFVVHGKYPNKMIDVHQSGPRLPTVVTIHG